MSGQKYGGIYWCPHRGYIKPPKGPVRERLQGAWEGFRKGLVSALDEVVMLLGVVCLIAWPIAMVWGLAGFFEWLGSIVVVVR